VLCKKCVSFSAIFCCVLIFACDDDKTRREKKKNYYNSFMYIINVREDRQQWP
jgi:hypothetical protein